VKAVCSGDKEAIALMKVTANAIGRALAIVVNILAPELVVLSGEQLKIGRSFVDSIKKVARENVVTQNYENLKIVISSYGSEIGAIGAASYVTQKVFSYNDMEV
ncbi:MAG: ROK family protein, partial [Lachnospiraceae bacterium]